MVGTPNTVAATSHAMVIRRQGSGTIGAVNEWNPRMTRQLTDLYCFGPLEGEGTSRFAEQSGEPFEVVPGNVSGMVIDVRRWDLFTAIVENALTDPAGTVPSPGNPGMTMLSNQIDAISLVEAWRSPSGANNFARTYAGVWWQDIGRQMRATDDRTVNAGGTLRYTRRDITPY